MFDLIGDMRKRVKAGIKFLDIWYEYNHGNCDWRSRLDLDSLDISRPDRCILGQLHGDYLEGLVQYGLDGWEECDYDHPAPMDLGFETHMSEYQGELYEQYDAFFIDSSEEHTVLTAIWKQELQGAGRPS